MTKATYLPAYLRDHHHKNDDAFARFCAVGLPSDQKDPYKYFSFEKVWANDALKHVPFSDEFLSHTAQGKKDEGIDADHPFDLLTSAYETEYKCLTLGKDHEGSPVSLRLIADTGHFYTPYIKVIVEEGADICFIDDRTVSSASWVHSNINIHVKQNARFSVLSISQNHGYVTDQMRVHIDHGASFSLYSLVNAQEGAIRSNIHVDVSGQESHVHLSYGVISKNKSTADIYAVIDHRIARARSDQNVRMIADDQSRLTYQGKVIAEKGADGTDANQMIRSVLLSPRAEVNAKPELEIYADDVKCAHGAACGALDEDQLFYLTSRGIPADLARQIILSGFMMDIVSGMPDHLLPFAQSFLARNLGEFYHDE